jgi:hypothetical protein
MLAYKLLESRKRNVAISGVGHGEQKNSGQADVSSVRGAGIASIADARADRAEHSATGGNSGIQVRQV